MIFPAFSIYRRVLGFQNFTQKDLEERLLQANLLQLPTAVNYVYFLSLTEI